MARGPQKPLEVDVLRHDAAERPNIRTAEFGSVMRRLGRGRTGRRRTCRIWKCA